MALNAQVRINGPRNNGCFYAAIVLNNMQGYVYLRLKTTLCYTSSQSAVNGSENLSRFPSGTSE